MMFPRHSFTTRLLLTCIRAKLYHKDTVDDLLAEIVRQAQDVEINGVQVPFLRYACLCGLHMQLRLKVAHASGSCAVE